MNEWREDPDAITILQMVNAGFERQTICFIDIDNVASANNCARMGNPISDEKVEEYAASMRRGDVFPMIVVERSKKGFVVLGGNQRLSAAKLFGISSCRAYVVNPLSDNHRQAVIRSLNARHGWGTEKTERIDHGVYLVRTCGFTAFDAARLMSVSDFAIQSRLRAEDLRVELSSEGITANKMSVKALLALDKISDEDAKKQVAKTAIAASVSADKINDVANAICSAKGKAKKSEIVKEWIKQVGYLSAEKQSDGCVKPIRNPRRDKFLKMLDGLVDFLDKGNEGSGFSTLGEIGCTEARDGDAVRLMTAKLNARLKLITGVF